MSSPIRSVIPSVQGAVLSVLARTERPLSGRAVAALVADHAGHRRVNQVLQEMATSGLVIRDKQPPAHLYRLNRDHVAAEAIVALADLRGLLLARITEQVTAWRIPAAAVWLFGSAARGEGGPDSDIDLLVLRRDAVDEDDPPWQEQIADLSNRVWTWTGNDCRALEYSQAQFAALASGGERLIDELRRDGITLSGMTVARATARSVS